MYFNGETSRIGSDYGSEPGNKTITARDSLRDSRNRVSTDGIITSNWDLEADAVPQEGILEHPMEDVTYAKQASQPSGDLNAREQQDFGKFARSDRTNHSQGHQKEMSEVVDEDKEKGHHQSLTKGSTKGLLCLMRFYLRGQPKPILTYEIPKATFPNTFFESRENF